MTDHTRSVSEPGRSADPVSESRAVDPFASAAAAVRPGVEFSWEDVHTLGEASNAIVYANPAQIDLAHAVGSIADRIASLLPPRDP